MRPNYLFIQSSGAGPHDDFAGTLAAALAHDGARVTLLLVQNGALAARRGARAPQLDALTAAGVPVLADEFALRERGIAEVAPNIAPTGIDTLVGALASGAKALWN